MKNQTETLKDRILEILEEELELEWKRPQHEDDVPVISGREKAAERILKIIEEETLAVSAVAIRTILLG